MLMEAMHLSPHMLLLPFRPRLFNDRPYPPTAARNQGTTAPYRYQCDPKGYLIFDTGMILNNRYRLEKRIGKGTFSKVFAALDIVTDNWVAVKVVRNAEKYQLAAKVELHILNMITEKDPDDKSNCIHLLDQFVYKGIHACFRSSWPEFVTVFFILTVILPFASFTCEILCSTNIGSS
eukprot:TRINITY_DN2979_c0_g1_i1.p1 TRINITY_DN2979_c0_g1~~TRINITY_DN2979_c0_g1_i1.p1  ORF type:complete len:178 (+),score=7.81 TRINITY_DN2979_c0_g1_i1:297-830(+)